ncbi:phosphoglucomutase [Paenibacillus selenitireducens]|uniref:Phosphoglucomutase n=1 Tax=Paenibacillus selenitireducens TaxID=1324314 RepID=A0A1T2XD28_9BACL|nr:phosphoglucomutase [Paenibacillus selenitireducens]OPA77523.1 phosphoglucomutase [Paenibacillus selenitireducens]
MAYPNGIDRFNEKLNKKLDGTVHVIEEKIAMTDGVYEGLLIHDNIEISSIKVYTGPRFTGEEVKNFIVSILSDTPWKISIKIFSNTPNVYVTYETPGDTIEADDINVLQSSVTETQKEIEHYKENGVIDGGSFVRGK